MGIGRKEREETMEKQHEEADDMPHWFKDQYNYQPGQDPEAEKADKKYLILLVVLIGLAVLAFGLFFLWSHTTS